MALGIAGTNLTRKRISPASGTFSSLLPSLLINHAFVSDLIPPRFPLVKYLGHLHPPRLGWP